MQFKPFCSFIDAVIWPSTEAKIPVVSSAKDTITVEFKVESSAYKVDIVYNPAEIG